MLSKLFILGRPGSGKSTVRHFITKEAQRKSLSPYPICDSKILRNLCRYDPSQTQIRPTGFGGFEVLDFSLLDNVLRTIERRVENALKRHPSELPRIAIIEFARSDYLQALSQFDPDFLKDAHFLILESDVDTCVNRIEKRTRRPEFVDDIFVPVNIMEGYYQKDSTPDSVRAIREAFGLSDQQIQLMRTDGSREEFLHECIKVHVQSLIEPAFHARRFVRTTNILDTSYTETSCNHCPSTHQEKQGGEEVNEQLDDIHERQLVGSASNQ